eukprot:3250665-Pyramimonas_sp.AAC.4
MNRSVVTETLPRQSASLCQSASLAHACAAQGQAPRAEVTPLSPHDIWAGFIRVCGYRHSRVAMGTSASSPLTSTAWPLSAAGRAMDGSLSGISAEDAYAAQKRNKAVLLDVRSADDGASDIKWMNSVRIPNSLYGPYNVPPITSLL